MEKIQTQMGTILVSEPMSTQQLRKAGEELYGDMVKAVIDLEKGVMAGGGEVHADEEAFFIVRKSRPEDMWGINLYTTRQKPEMVEFDFMINIQTKPKK